MPISRRFLAPLAFSALLGAAAAPSAQGADQVDSAVFDLTLRGVYAGSLSVSGAVEGKSYVVSGVLKSGGLVALLRKVRYDARSRGTVSGSGFTPARYEEDADTGKRKSQAVMEYVAGVPQVKTYNPPKPPREGAVDPASQGGTVDPLTATFAALRDQPEGAACNSKLTMFDGRRRSQVTLAKPVASGTGILCAGEYRRLAGFSDKDMAEKTRFPFEMRLEPTGDGKLRVVEVSMDTLYGKGRLKRR